MSKWAVDDVVQWLNSNGFRKYTRKCRGFALVEGDILVHLYYNLEQNIDGHRLIQLTDEGILQLLTRSNDEGNEEQPTIGAQTRFRKKLIEFRQIYTEEKKQKKFPSANMVESTEIPQSHVKRVQWEIIKEYFLFVE